MRSRHGTSIATNTVIVAALALLVFVVLALIYMKYIGGTVGTLDDCGQKGGVCCKGNPLMDQAACSRNYCESTDPKKDYSSYPHTNCIKAVECANDKNCKNPCCILMKYD